MSFDGDLVRTLAELIVTRGDLGDHNDEVFGNPEIDPEAFVHPTAKLIGRVYIEKNVLVAPNVSLRGDEGGPFRICSGSNIQDGVILHGHLERFVIGNDGVKYSIYIGERTTVAHRALLHGPLLLKGSSFIGASSLVWGSEVGNGCVIDHAAKVVNSTLGDGCMVGINAVVRNVTVPSGMYVPDQARVVKQEHVLRLRTVRPSELQSFMGKNQDIVEINHSLVTRHKRRSELLRRQRTALLEAKFSEVIRVCSKHPAIQGNPTLFAAVSALASSVSEEC